MSARKLTPGQRAEIARRYVAGETSTDLARKFGVTRPLVGRCVRAAWFEIRPYSGRSSAPVAALKPSPPPMNYHLLENAPAPDKIKRIPLVTEDRPPTKTLRHDRAAGKPSRRREAP